MNDVVGYIFTVIGMYLTAVYVIIGVWLWTRLRPRGASTRKQFEMVIWPLTLLGALIHLQKRVLELEEELRAYRIEDPVLATLFQLEEEENQQ